MIEVFLQEPVKMLFESHLKLKIFQFDLTNQQILVWILNMICLVDFVTHLWCLSYSGGRL